MFSFLQNEALHGRINVKAPNTEYSRAIGLDALGNVSELHMRSVNDTDIALGCQIYSGSGKVMLFTAFQTFLLIIYFDILTLSSMF
jgi:hypothetical protein